MYLNLLLLIKFLVPLIAAIFLSYLINYIGRYPALKKFNRRKFLYQTIIWLVAVAFLISNLIQVVIGPFLYVLLFLILVIILLNMGLLNNLFAGLLLALEDRLQVGQYIAINEISGIVESFQLTFVRVKTLNQTICEIPNTTFFNKILLNQDQKTHGAVCEITLVIPFNLPINQAKELAYQAASLNAFACPYNKAEIFLLPNNLISEPPKILIRGYAFDPTYKEHFTSELIGRLYENFQKNSQPKRHSIITE
ncbi:MAG: mechanosensitive ion channel [Acidobacteria bacterium]|nr:mechanosensitive ion channel [Acidobacteriota bacterium]